MDCLECSANQYKFRLEFAGEEIARKDTLIAALRHLLATEREKNRQLVDTIRWLEDANTTGEPHRPR
jgi:hypothetical protein